jgi:hypothetical protein
MTTRIELINRSLQRIGASALQSESAPNAERLIRMYEDNLEELLGYKRWRWSFETVQLSRDAEGEKHPFWNYRYKLPAARLGAPVAVFDRKRSDQSNRPGGEPFTDYELHGEHLVTDAELIFARVQKKPPMHFWPPLFTACQRLLVSADAAAMLHEDDKKRLQLRREALGDERVPGDFGLIGKAAAADAQNQPSETIMDEDGPLIDVRY